MIDTKGAIQLHNDKNDQYFAYARHEMLSFVPKDAKLILDVGCGVGLFGQALKKRSPCKVIGVEIISSKAAEARSRLDEVVEGPFDSFAPSYKFDCIVFNDVLEHMADPIAALTYSKSLLNSSGCVVASIPNIRHFPTVWKLVVNGRWDYRDGGTLDHGHLRFFTCASLPGFFASAGYRIVRLEGINRYCVNNTDEHSLWRYLKILQLFFPKKFRDMGYLQFAVLAHPVPSSKFPKV